MVAGSVLLAGAAGVALPANALAATSPVTGLVTGAVTTAGNVVSSAGSTVSTVGSNLGGSVGGTVSGAGGTVSGVGNTVDGVSTRVGGWGDSAADANAKDSNGKNQPSMDAGSLATVTTAIGARKVWATTDAAGRAVTGKGVTVALLDSGVNSSVAGLNGAGKVVAGPDLSLEDNSPSLQGRDTFGHGTFLAGIIAARDAVDVDATTGQPKPASASVQLGVAPDANVLAVRLATTDGSTDVSEVIAGLDWVVQHRNDNGMSIRVLNLSYGTDSVQSYQVDPLAAAVENAWKHGIVVVASGGNEGSAAGRLTDPAIDPYVIAVGASDPKSTVAGWNAPSVAAFSSVGSANRHVDLVAPGTSIVSFRDPGSFIDTNHPEGLVAGDSTGRLFRGSGTSQAAAVVSGAVALLLQAYPTLTPDEVKAALVNSADQMPGSTVAKGAGQLNVAAALGVAKTISGQLGVVRQLLYPQRFTPASGMGSLEAARGGSDLADPDTGAVLSGEVDVQGQPWIPSIWSPASAAGMAWAGGRWNGAVWSGSSWAGSSWTNVGWSGARWSGARWSDAGWTSARWSGARWTGAGWTSARWTGAGWQ